uniref:Exostosin GT47 domain-containing protein n=1 Tax=Rhodosorus marinus TaxID=101924 RepID=A0A7S3EF44_9RHOD|mmetsp:Transcript_28885/g.112514  ORF Transcript_28885/g.112514 Transcript_28885/m.112514 type:complete len:351 (+) Transcript_28885:1099-2151(+)
MPFISCYATIGQRGTNTMEVLSIVFNETMNILDRHAPGRNWTGRFVVPFSHDFGGCVRFAMEEKLKEELIVGQPPVLQQSVVLSAFGDWDDSNCFDLKKDIVMPAYIDYESLDAVNEIPKSSKRRYMIYFAGTLDFDLRKRGIRKTLTDKKNYKHPEKHVLDRLETRAEYNYVLHNTIFCVGPPGVVGWTGRVWEALYSGCIPVFLSEKTKHPWEEYVDYRKFSIMLDYSFADKLEGFLEAMDMKEIERLQEEGQKYKEMFIYRPPFNQEDGPFSFMFKSLRERKETLEGHLNEGDLPRSVRRDQAWREEEQVAHEPDRRKEEAEDSNPARKTTRTRRLRQGRERGTTRN